MLYFLKSIPIDHIEQLYIVYSLSTSIYWTLCYGLSCCFEAGIIEVSLSVSCGVVVELMKKSQEVVKCFGSLNMNMMNGLFGSWQWLVSNWN